TTNPVLAGLVITAAILVVAARRPTADWAGGFRAYLIVALAVIVIRVLFRVVLGGAFGTHVLLSLPRLALPSWAGGITLGGPVTLEAALAALNDGLRLAAIVVCVGSANTLVDPRRLLRSLPRALHDVGNAAAVALSLAPQLVESFARIRRAEKLRGQPDHRSIRQSLIAPVLEDAMQRSLAMAAAMDSRGYGHRPDSTRAGSASTALAALGGLCLGTFGLMGSTMSPWASFSILMASAALGATGMIRSGKKVKRTVYRPSPWRMEEWLVAGCGVMAAVAVWSSALIQPAALVPSLIPLSWPTLPFIPLLGIALAALPAWLAPPVSPSVYPSRISHPEGAVS
ncbi:MAG: energy-coupling factor transporter transmembrane component T, partial [Acidimicrobiia bacterium]